LAEAAPRSGRALGVGICLGTELWPEIVRKLLAHGASLETLNSYGGTVLSGTMWFDTILSRG